MMIGRMSNKERGGCRTKGGGGRGKSETADGREACQSLDVNPGESVQRPAAEATVENRFCRDGEPLMPKDRLQIGLVPRTARIGAPARATGRL